MKKRILCICAQGLNRSKYLAKYLRNKGYSTRFGGIKRDSPKSVKKEDIEWADIIIITRKRLRSIFKRKYKNIKKKIIVIDVTDSKRLISKEFSYLKKLNYEVFQKKWTRPQLRKAIKKYLPL